MKGVQCYELFGGISLKNHTFSFFFFRLINTNGTMIDMCQKFHTNNLACLKECYDQLCQMLRTGQAVLIKIHFFCQDLKGYHLWFYEVMSVISVTFGGAVLL